MEKADNQQDKYDQFLQNQTSKGKLLRLIHSVRHLALQENESYELFFNWLEEEADNQLDTLEMDKELMVSLSNDLKSLTVYQAGPVEDYIEKTLRFISEIGDNEEEFEMLQNTGRKLAPEAAGYWLQLCPDHVEAGWYFPVENDLLDVVQFIETSEDKKILEQWADEYESAFCLQIRRSIGEPLPMIEILIQLEEESIEKYFETAGKLFEKFDITWFGNELEKTLKDLGVNEIGLVIGMNKNGLCSLGILIFEQNDELVLTLANLSGDFSHEKLAHFHGYTLSDGPEFIILYQEEKGPKADLFHII